MSTASICSLSLVELANNLQQGKLKSVEICQAFLDEAEQASSLNCFITLDRKHILDAAADADKLRKNGDQRPFLGVPVAIKDIILTEGMRTTCASRILEKFVPPYDATVMIRLKSDGFIPFGKTNMDEFAMGSSNETSFFGPVRNPWDAERVPGGSSGGSAAAVAARIVPAALGTDTGGSIRQPASLCGVVGLKPTYGRVSRYGVIAFASSLDQVGVFAQTARDCAVLIESISGHDPFDATSSTLPRPNLSSCINESVKGLRIGIPKEYFIPGMNTEVEGKVRKAIAQLADLGMEVVDISLPHSEAAVSVYYIVAPAEASSNLARYDGIRYGFRAEDTKDLRDVYIKSRSQGFGAEVKRRIMIGTYVLSSGYYDAFYRSAQKVRTLITQDFRSVFGSQCDIIAAPTAPSTAFRLGEKTDNPLEMYLNDIFTIPVNLAGLPGLSIPCGFDQSGLPIGLQLIGKHWDEATLLRVASAYEQATEWHRKHPSRTWSTNQ